MNYKVRINQKIAEYYGHDTDIPEMPDFAGSWIIDELTFKFWIGIMRQDLERELSPYMDGYPDLIAALRRQIATLEKRVEVDLPVAEPAGRKAHLEAAAARQAAFDAAEAESIAKWRAANPEAAASLDARVAESLAARAAKKAGI